MWSPLKVHFWLSENYSFLCFILFKFRSSACFHTWLIKQILMLNIWTSEPKWPRGVTELHCYIVWLLLSISVSMRTSAASIGRKGLVSRGDLSHPDWDWVCHVDEYACATCVCCGGGAVGRLIQPSGWASNFQIRQSIIQTAACQDGSEHRWFTASLTSDSGSKLPDVLLRPTSTGEDLKRGCAATVCVQCPFGGGGELVGV